MKNQARITVAGSILLTASAPAANAQMEVTVNLLESEDWLALKNIWKLLDKVKPAEDYLGYNLATEKGDSLNSALRSLFTENNLENPHLELALSLVTSVTSARVTRLSRMNPLYVTRMIPPWTSTVQEDLLFNFEDRITTLTALVDSGEVTATEFIAARAALLEKAETIALLEILNDVHGNNFYDRVGGSYLTDPDSDEILEMLDLSYRAALDTLSSGHLIEQKDYYYQVVAQHEEFLLRYENFQQAKPLLRILLTDLMEAGN